jgi:hypothetical protein
MLCSVALQVPGYSGCISGAVEVQAKGLKDGWQSVVLFRVLCLLYIMHSA